MKAAANFRRGDKVLSPCHFKGVVSKVESGTVSVDYRELGRDGVERHTEGIYDAAWFARWPGMLTRLAA